MPVLPVVRHRRAGCLPSLLLLRPVSTPAEQLALKSQQEQRGRRISQDEEIELSGDLPDSCQTAFKRSLWLMNKKSRVDDHHHDRQGSFVASLSCKGLNEDELLLLTLSEKGQLDRALDVLSQLGTPASSSVYLSLLKECKKNKALIQAKKVHAHLVRSSPQLTGLLGDYLVMTLAKCGAIEDARQVSGTLPHRTVFSWTAMISAYADCGRGDEALLMHQLMEEDGVEPNSYTFVSLFKACGSILDLGQGKKLHADAHRRGLTSDVFVGSTLIRMYGKCGAVVDAEDVFGALLERDLVSWNAMISAYVEHGQGEKALQLYRQMQEEGVRGNQHTPVFSLQACRILAEKEEALVVEGKSTRMISLEIGQALHADACRNGLASDVFVGSTLVRMYGKCGAVVDAEHAFHAVSHRNAVLWNAMLSTYVEHSYGDRALHFYRQMQEEGISPDQHTLVFALQACGTLAENEETLIAKGRSTKVLSLEIVRALHADACMEDFAFDAFVATTLLSMYGKCGAIVEAEDVFGASTQCDVVSWNAMLSAYIEQGQEEKALQMYRQLGEEGLNPDELTLVLALQACGAHGEKEETLVVEGQSTKMLSLEIGRALHADACKKGFESSVSVRNTLVSMYGKCGGVDEAENVFGASRQHDIVSWNVMLSAYIDHGQGEKVLQLYRQMQEEDISPDQLTLVMALQACGTLAKKEASLGVQVTPLEIGQALHTDALRKGYTTDVLVVNTLVSMYGKFGAVMKAEDVFCALSNHDIVSWNAMLFAYVEHGQGHKALHLYRQMQLEGVHPDELTHLMALQACDTFSETEEALAVKGQSAEMMSLEILQALHADALMKDFELDVFIGSAMVSMYGKCGAMIEAEAVFGALPQRDLVSWSAMLSAYFQQGQGEKALRLYRQMQEEGVTTNRHSVVFLLQTCGALAEKEGLFAERRITKAMSLEIGQALHAYAWRKGWTSDVHVCNTLVSMYGKCGAIGEAEDTFDALPERNVVSLNAMLSAYIEQDQGKKALQLHRQMLKEGMSPDQLTYVMALQACGTLAEKEEALDLKGQYTKVVSLAIGQALHADACNKGFVLDIYVASALVTMYGKCGAVVEAEDVFGASFKHNVVSWNAMLSAHVQYGQEEKALKLYREMQKQCETLDDVTLLCLLQACSATGSLDICKHLHFNIVSAGHDPIPFVAATLIHAYGSCASMADAQALFDELSEPDIVSWNACIDGHAGEGNSVASQDMFENLNFVGIKPDKVTFTSVLSACSHTGLAVKGLEYFESMSRNYGIDPDVKHYGSMLDLLGRAGDFKRIQDMLGRMQIWADLNVWLGLLGACRTHGNLDMAKQAFNHAVNSQPEDATAYVFMSNIYADTGFQECGAELEISRQTWCMEEAWQEMDRA